MRRPRLAGAGMVAAGVCAGCASYAPSDGPHEPGSAYRQAELAPATRPALATDEAGLWMVMDDAERRLQTAGNLVRDPALNAYVRDVTCRVAGPYCADIRVYILRVPDFNAAMAPNGAMTLWTGLLLRSRNEAQLATIIGHEIGHYLARHSVKRWRDARSKTDFLAFFGIATGAAGVGWVADLAAVGVIAGMFAYSRDNEREADDLGLKVMADAGYDPREAPTVWRHLVREQAADPDARTRSVFFATHPAAEERLDTLAAGAARLAAGGVRGEAGRDAYEAAMLPHRAAFLRDELDVRRFERLDALLTMLLEDPTNEGELLYYRGEFYRLRNRDGDLDNALAAYRAAESHDGPPPELFRSAGLVHARKGERDLARAAFSRYLALKPDAEDRELIRLMMEPAQ
ncbi:MAG: M48 family metalloprotease [Rhodospirillales bacterium]